MVSQISSFFIIFCHRQVFNIPCLDYWNVFLTHFPAFNHHFLQSCDSLSIQPLSQHSLSQIPADPSFLTMVSNTLDGTQSPPQSGSTLHPQASFCISWVMIYQSVSRQKNRNLSWYWNRENLKFSLGIDQTGVRGLKQKENIRVL